MPYLIDRGAALLVRQIVAVLNIRHHRVRSRVILRDGSLYQTLTRPRTLARRFKARGKGLFSSKQGERWQTQP